MAGRGRATLGCLSAGAAMAGIDRHCTRVPVPTTKSIPIYECFLLTLHGDWTVGTNNNTRGHSKLHFWRIVYRGIQT